MQQKKLDGMRVAIIVTDDFEQSEFTEPKRALEQAGATVMVIAPHDGEVKGMKHDEKANAFKVDMTLTQVNPDDFDGLMLPGGALNADKLRMDKQARYFVQRIDQAGKPMAVICHAPWLLVSAGIVKGRTLTSYYTLQDDIRNAGGNWVDQAMVRDRNVVTSRSPQDFGEFNPAMITLFAEYKNRVRA